MLKRAKSSRQDRGKYRKIGWLAAILLFFALLLYGTYREPFRDADLSTALFDSEGNLLGARVAADGQWRFGVPDSLPQNYVDALLLYEDQYFRFHPGVNPVSLLRATGQNLRAGRIVSGGSTISMQVIRLSRGAKKRNVTQKIVEILLAVQLEMRESKADILRLYASYAPFGGNVVGMEAASWRYFGRAPGDMTWAEASLLAVLPNSPALIHPGRNPGILKNKRDALLLRLLDQGKMDSTDYSLAISEPLPGAPLPLPNHAPHLVDRYLKEETGRIPTTIQVDLQDRIAGIINTHLQGLAGNQIANMAVLVLDNRTGQMLAYHGNGSIDGRDRNGRQVDIIQSRRSSGSVLKPLLFAAMLDAGEILPHTLVPDIPTRYEGFAPQNFDKRFDGAVPADEALIRSLNVPAVRMLREHGYSRFYDLLKKLGLTTLDRQASHYGLSLILGGAEICLWDICHAYSRMANALVDQRTDVFSPGAVYLSFEAMKKVKRPESEAGWENFTKVSNMAWKTGTSFGFRDAWAVGVNPAYTVGVWVGNASGEGRPGLTGSSVAAPVLFDVAGLLPETDWFQAPDIFLDPILVCHESGMRASENCTDIDTIFVPPAGIRTDICPYHIRIAMDEKRQYRVHADCYPVHLMQYQNWFVLPPGIAGYFVRKNPFYHPLPPWRPDCYSLRDEFMEILYPVENEEIYLPLNALGERQGLLVDAAHSYPETRVFWFLNEEYLGSTRGLHRMEILPEYGRCRLSLTDENGNATNRQFTILKSAR